MNKEVTDVQFSVLQMEWGDLNLVNSIIDLMGWEFPVPHPFQRPGHQPSKTMEIDLHRATKLLLHSEWTKGWFRPRVCQNLPKLCQNSAKKNTFFMQHFF